MPGTPGATVGIRDLAAACGVESIWTVEEEDPEDRMRSVFREALTTDTLCLIIVRKTCKLP